MELQSYVEGKWQRGSGNGLTLVNPSTEQALGTATAEGLDFSRALTHARGEGGPALAQMSFAQRGEMLRTIAKAVHANRDELHRPSPWPMAATPAATPSSTSTAPSARSPPTPICGVELGDAHASCSTARACSSAAARASSASTCCVRATGVAVHINAFNFPAWGLGEKAAAALLAGHAGDHQAGHEHRARGPPHRRDHRRAASCCRRARFRFVCGQRRRSARSPRRRRTCWRSPDRATPAQAPRRTQAHRAQRARQRRGRQPQRGGARARRRRRLAT